MARALAIGAILVAGLAGGLIGYAVTDVSCIDGCPNWAAFGAAVGAITAAAGVAVVAVLTLRAVGEWRSIEEQRAIADQAPKDPAPRDPAE